MSSHLKNISGPFVKASLLTAFLAVSAFAASAATLPRSTALPVAFSTTLEAGKVRVNDPVRAHTMQQVVLPDGTQIPKGAVLLGHVTESTGFHFDETPYAAQKPSILGIHFDQVELKNGVLPAHFTLRAIAGAGNVENATRPVNATDSEPNGPIVLVGGDTYYPPDEKVRARNGNVVAYVRKNGIYAHLLPAEAKNAPAGMSCDAVPTEQSVAVFSAEACGVYGVYQSSLANNGNDGSGTFVLSSTQNSVTIPAHSAALLESAE